MYNSPYFIPRFSPSMINPNLMRGASQVAMFNGARGASQAASMLGSAKGTGILSRLGSGLAGIKTINWGGLINNTSKTLGIINQTIPLVRQVGPMMNNMKSMLRVASLFKDETDIRGKNSYSNSYYYDNSSNKFRDNFIQINNDSNTYRNQSSNYNEFAYDDSPTFFIGS